MRPKPEPIVGLDPDLFASPKPRGWWDVCRPSLLAGLVAAGSLGVPSLALNPTSRADDAPNRPQPVSPRVRLRVVPLQRAAPPIQVDPFVITPRKGIDDAMIIAAPQGIDDAMIIVRGGLTASSPPR